jgi:predicted enzyme related to lactoylglutathione lyase
MFKDTQAYSSFSVDDVATAKEFYEDVLGLDVEQDDEMDMPMLKLHLGGGGTVMVYPKGQAHEPASFTVLNFPVDDIDEAVDQLAEKGISFEHYDNEFIKTDDKGIGRDPNGPAIAWFKDPAGNVLAVMQER